MELPNVMPRRVCRTLPAQSSAELHRTESGPTEPGRASLWHALKGLPPRVAGLLASIVLLGTSCTVSYDTPDLAGKDVRLTILHTSDIHSRLIPYEFNPLYTDQVLGLDPDKGPFGGMARLATLVKRERAKASRVMHLDSGDCFQGAPIFNLFKGEVEMRAMSELNPTAVVVGNHEFDAGAENYASQMEQWANFPSLAANYVLNDPSLPYANTLGALVKPYHVVNLYGLKVGIIGMGNLSSLNSIFEGGNSIGAIPLDTIETAQAYVDILRGSVDLIFVVSHLGLEEDIEIARKVPGISLIAGGHLHVAINPPKTVINEATGEEVIIMHSGAFNKYLGRMDLVVRDGKILSHAYQLFPLDRTVPDDAEMLELMEPYVVEMNMTYDLNRVVGIATEKINRFGSGGGDGALGNFVAEAMQLRNRVETDFCLTNTLGIRTDFQEGEVTLEELYNVLPFENTVTTMFLSGKEVQELFDYVAFRSSERGCNSQAQISGATFTMDCLNRVSRDITIGGTSRPCEVDAECADLGERCIGFTAGGDTSGRCQMPISDNGVYELATNDYIAAGGSGFEVLAQNTTQYDTGIPIRTVVLEYLQKHPVIPDYDSGIAVEDGRIRVVYGDEQ